MRSCAKSSIFSSPDLKIMNTHMRVKPPHMRFDVKKQIYSHNTWAPELTPFALHIMQNSVLPPMKYDIEQNESMTV